MIASSSAQRLLMDGRLLEDHCIEFVTTTRGLRYRSGNCYSLHFVQEEVRWRGPCPKLLRGHDIINGDSPKIETASPSVVLPRVGVVERAYRDVIGYQRSQDHRRRDSQDIPFRARSFANLFKEASPVCHVPGIVSLITS